MPLILRDMVIKRTATAVVLLFLGFLAGLGSMDWYFARLNLKKDADYLLREFHSALGQTRFALQSIPETLNLDNREQTQKLLSEQVYQASYLRWIGIVADGQVLVASSPAFVDTQTLFKETNPEGEFSIAITGRPDAGENLFYIRRMGKFDYMMSITPFHINFLTEFVCRDCVDYYFRISGEKQLDYIREKPGMNHVVSYTTIKEDDDIQVSLTLKADRKFLNHYRMFGWATSCLIAFVLALLLGVFFYKFQLARRSQARLIRDGIQNNEFHPFYQPIVDSRTQRVVGAEMLARWVRPNKPAILPYQFIPFAEERGLILPITEQLVRKAVRDIKNFGWDDSGLYLSINLVPEHLENDRGFHMITTLAREAGVPFTAFAVELTERHPLKDLKQAKKALNRFADIGIDVKIDDAGTGYGGFSYVQEFPISTLKIDKMFIDTLDHKTDVKAQVLDAIITFARTSGLKIIAEGVETEGQISDLQKRGVYHIQGYVYAKPMPADQFDAWLKGFPSISPNGDSGN